MANGEFTGKPVFWAIRWNDGLAVGSLLNIIMIYTNCRIDLEAMLFLT